MTFRPPIAGTAGEFQEVKIPRNPWINRGEGLSRPLPPGDWMEPDFDDAGWPRRRGPISGGYGFTRPPETALICLRGTFGVAEPAKVKDLKIKLSYRGGVVVFMNGKDAARGHLPEGNIDPLTPAADYPREVYVTPDGEDLLPDVEPRRLPEDLLPRYQARIRNLTARIPGGLLKKGRNVLALRIHRTAVPVDLPLGRGSWDTAGFLGIELEAPEGSGVLQNVSAPGGIQVWSADPMLRVGKNAEYGDPFDPPASIQLMAPRNGFSSQQVVVSSAEELPSLSARIGDLESPEGATIRESAFRVRHADIREEFVPLLEKPVRAARIQPIWVTVQVPRETEPGTYRGSLEIQGLHQPTAVPVELTVYAWKLGDPRQWKTFVNILQSPESVAGYYGVSLWSHRHFQLLEKSFRLMGELGNDLLGISAVGKNVFGDDPLIVFRKVGSTYEPEFKFLERYLELYNKFAGEPQFLSLHVWSYGMYQRGKGRDGGKVEKRVHEIPLVELKGDRLVPFGFPIYGKPGTEKLWRQVMDGLLERVQGLGWRKECILLGTSGDGWPSPETVSMFEKVAPYARWRAITHGSGVPRWGHTDEGRRQPNGMVVGYLERVRRIRNRKSPIPGVPVACNSRDMVKADPFQHRALPVVNIFNANYEGFCWKGLDYWAYISPDGKKRSALNTYVRFGNIVGSTPRTLSMPGPEGAVATVQLECMRQGIQDCEAMIFIRDSLESEVIRGKIPDALAGRCRNILERFSVILETGSRISPQGGADIRGLTRELYQAASEVARIR